MRLLIKKIAPDIVNISGSENPYYSIAALDIENMPLLITAQTVYANPSRQNLSGHVDKFRWELELEIFKKTKYYASGATMHRDLILMYRPDAIVLKVQGSAPEVPAFEGSKEYDFAFFAAQVTPKKGIIDALEAFRKVRESSPDVSLNIIGSWEPGLMNELCPGLELGKLREGILYSGYFENHDDMLRQVQKSRFALLPVKLDAVSGTIRESMLMGLPIVTYRTSGTPALNKDRENVLLADIGDTETLACNMLRLLEDAEFANCISNRAIEYAEKEFSYKKNIAQWIAVLEAVYQHYYEKSEIPKELLFSADRFPVYH
jgi:glycosyltransferase involved in cell wall biosynthesis